MSAYFRTNPYSSWFAGFEPLLNGVGSSYYTDTAASTALHTDICSPVATDPTWTKLGSANQAALAADGVPLWHVLVKALRPQIVILSMAKEHLGHIKFMWTSHWETLVVFERTEDDRPRGRYQVKARWYEVGGELSLFVFGRATQKPFGSMSNNQKGDYILDYPPRFLIPPTLSKPAERSIGLASIQVQPVLSRTQGRFPVALPLQEFPVIRVASESL